MNVVRARAAVEQIAKSQVPNLPHLASYPAKVVNQLADGSLEAVPDNDKIHGESSIAIRTGLPGVTLKVPKGTRVQVAYEEGDASKPVAHLWVEGMADELEIEVGDELRLKAAGQPAAEHLVTLEQVLQLLIWFFDPVVGASSALDAATMGWKVVPAAYPAPTNVVEPKLITFLQSAAGFTPFSPALAAALQAAIAGQLPKPPAVSGLGQVAPGIACKGVLSG